MIGINLQFILIKYQPVAHLNIALDKLCRGKARRYPLLLRMILNYV